MIKALRKPSVLAGVCAAVVVAAVGIYAVSRAHHRINNGAPAKKKAVAPAPPLRVAS